MEEQSKGEVARVAKTEKEVVYVFKVEIALKASELEKLSEKVGALNKVGTVKMLAMRSSKTQTGVAANLHKQEAPAA